MRHAAPLRAPPRRAPGTPIRDRAPHQGQSLGFLCNARWTPGRCAYTRRAPAQQNSCRRSYARTPKSRTNGTADSLCKRCVAFVGRSAGPAIHPLDSALVAPPCPLCRRVRHARRVVACCPLSRLSSAVSRCQVSEGEPVGPLRRPRAISQGIQRGRLPPGRDDDLLTLMIQNRAVRGCSSSWRPLPSSVKRPSQRVVDSPLRRIASKLRSGDLTRPNTAATRPRTERAAGPAAGTGARNDTRTATMPDTHQVPNQTNRSGRATHNVKDRG